MVLVHSNAEVKNFRNLHPFFGLFSKSQPVLSHPDKVFRNEAI